MNRPESKNSFTYEDIFLAYLDCRRRKGNTAAAISFARDWEFGLFDLLNAVNSRSYFPGRSRVFVVHYPKVREVWAAQFSDRIIHHLLCREIAPFFERRFIEDTYACLKGRGTLVAAERFMSFASSITQNWSKPAYVLKGDVANFFVSIDHAIVWSLISPWLAKDSLTAWLCELLIFHNPTINPIVKDPASFKLVPPHKSLWHCGQGKGLPIGNLTSQFFANFYLDGLDKLAKHKLKIRHYLRYMDDILCFSESPEELAAWREELDAWLKEKRALSLHGEKTEILPVLGGFEFVGRFIAPFHSTPRQLVTTKAKKIAAKARKSASPRNLASLQSYLGMFIHANTYELRKRLCAGFEAGKGYAKIAAICQPDSKPAADRRRGQR